MTEVELLGVVLEISTYFQRKGEHGAEEDLMAYLRKKVEAWVKKQKSKTVIVPNEKKWSEVKLPSNALLISPILIPQTSSLFEEREEEWPLLDAEVTESLGVNNVRIYLGSFVEEATTSLISGTDEKGRWVLLNKDVWERNKEDITLLKERLRGELESEKSGQIKQKAQPRRGFRIWRLL